MDKYLSAIESEERKLSILNNRRKALVDTNKKKKQVIDKCDADEKRLNAQQDDNLMRKEFLEHRKEYIKEFLQASIKFGIKSSLWFLIIVGLLALIDANLGSTINIEVIDIIFGNSAIAVMLGSVEYYSVSRCYRQLVSGYRGNVDGDIESTYQEISLLQRRRVKVKDEILSNEQLLAEVDLAIKEVQAKILEYRTSRNDLIESLIEELDVHIRDFEYQESDIHKVLEKQIQ